MCTVAVNGTAEWRSWPAQNSRSDADVWLVVHHKTGGMPSVPEAIEQALCHGWIDDLTAPS